MDTQAACSRDWPTCGMLLLISLFTLSVSMCYRLNVNNFLYLSLQQFLKEILNELCVYNKRGTNQGTYELKPEYKKSVEDTGAEPWLGIVCTLDYNEEKLCSIRKETQSLTPYISFRYGDVPRSTIPIKLWKEGIDAKMPCY